MYNGQAKLKLYEDTSCTKEIRLSPTGEYILNARIVTGHASGTYNKNIYIKKPYILSRQIDAPLFDTNTRE